MNARVSVVLLGAAMAVGSGAMAAAYGGVAGMWTGLFLFLTGAPVLTVSHVVAHHRGRLGPLSRQLGGGVALSIGLALVGVELIALLLFVSAHDALTLLLLLSLTGTLAAYSAWLLTTRVAKDVEAVKDAVVAVAAGSRDEHVEVESNDEVAELADAANQLTTELARSDAERRTLMAAVSHDLRTPLSSLRLLVEGLEDGMAGGEAPRDVLSQMSFQIESLDTLIEDLFELSRIEAGDVTWPLELVEPMQLIEETIDGMRPHAHAQRVLVEAKLPSALPRLSTNPEKAQRVLFNLLENAIYHTPPEGRVTVTAEVTPSAIEVEIADTGEGIPEDEQPRIFEPFFRGGPEAARPRDGAGLGLPISRAIVKALGGEIWLVRSDDLGTRMRFSLPRPT